MTSRTRVLVWDRQQQPFGETESITGTKTLNLRFPGQLFDPENNTNYNMMRNYDPSIGRYVESDMSIADGLSQPNMNLYGYANQNPITWHDPDGRVAIALAPVILPALIRAGALATGIILADVIPFPPISRPQTDTDEDELCGNQEDDDCYERYLQETAQCEAIKRKRGNDAARRCYASAAERLAACIKGKPIPPFDIYDN